MVSATATTRSSSRLNENDLIALGGMEFYDHSVCCSVVLIADIDNKRLLSMLLTILSASELISGRYYSFRYVSGDP